VGQATRLSGVVRGRGSVRAAAGLRPGHRLRDWAWETVGVGEDAGANPLVMVGAGSAATTC
jgi:hypothetical protein